MKKITVRMITYILGLIIVSFGVSLTIKADLGAGAWDALNVGLSTTFGLTVGSWVIIVGIILILLNGFLLKKRPEFLAVFTIVIVGLFIDFWLLQVLDGWVLEGFILQFLVMASGLVLISFGIAMYLQAKYPLIPIDNFMMAIQKRTGTSITVSKTIAEVSALVLAFLFQGPIGIGTLFITFLIGPIIQFFFPKLEVIVQNMQKS